MNNVSSSRLTRSSSSKFASRAAVAASINWPALSRRANATLSNLRSTVDSPSFESALRARIAQDDQNPFLWHALAKHLAIDRTDVNAAISVLQTAIRRVPPGSRGGLFEAWGTMEHRRGNSHLALRIYADALHTDPYAALFVSLAVIQLKLHLIDDARRTLRDASVAFPSYAPIWRAWAYLETQHGPIQDALQKWRTALRKDPSNARAWNTYINAERRSGASQTRLATLLNDAISNCPKNTQLHLSLARVEEKRKGFRAARAVLFPLHTQDDLQVLRQLGRIDFETRNFDSGRAFFRRAADIESASATDFRNGKRRTKRRTVKSLHAWAHMEVRTAHTNRAKALLQEAISVCETDSGVWRAVAEIESRNRNYDKARAAFEKALAIDPNDPRIVLAYGRTEALAGNLKRAESLIESVSKMGSNRKTPLFSTGLKENAVADEIFEDDTSASRFKASQSDEEDSRDMTLTPHMLATTLKERAMLAFRDGRLDDSISLLNRATEVNPSAEANWRLLAAHTIRRHGMPHARAVYQKALKKVNPRCVPKVLHWWGQDERTAGHIDEARQLFVKATENNPRYMAPWVSWGLLEKSQNNLERACKIFEEAATRAEEEGIKAPYLFQTWGRIEELQRGRPDAAAEIFSRGVRIAPGSGSLWGSWGLLEHRRGNHEKARDMFRAATSAEPSIGSAWHSWALLEASRCNYGYARQLFQMGHENDPANASLLTSWALLEGKEIGNVAKGRDLYELAVKSDPLHAPAWHSWGCLEMNAGNIVRAKELLSKASQVRKDDPSAWHTLGVLEAEHNDNEREAIKNWKKALDASPGHSLTYQSWAVFLARKGRMGYSREIFKEGIEKAGSRAPDKAMLLQAWASAEQKNDNLDKARELLNKSIEADKRRAESWQLLAGLARRRGLRDEARELYRSGVYAASGSPSLPLLYLSWGSLEAEDGEVKRAREVFESGINKCPSNRELWKAYAAFEEQRGNPSRAKELEEEIERLFVRRELGTMVW
ncbi:PsbB mRNA maturation factor Mbb1, chloroplastic [Gracilariopsis chorda]|uniref:PsbB mRNA maturation factor Mbb1, chloroplastic n=1 Tax=Gracilariopsis chorda TaxID=448386 RepID=A0A2V3IHQ5_9FLOR|nr:PsbB mRNA maturation factor Mbb1, chloroplastic [Gracilariopsis chorda]|eukprot:PXF41568.1 PsbB mRNA maturation factor Mbb1, chloroplastic [Gracilariopsis chorda]